MEAATNIKKTQVLAFAINLYVNLFAYTFSYSGNQRFLSDINLFLNHT